MKRFIVTLKLAVKLLNFSRLKFRCFMKDLGEGEDLSVYEQISGQVKQVDARLWHIWIALSLNFPLPIWN